MQPVNISGELKRVLKNADPQNIPDIDINVGLNDLECCLSQKSLRLVFSILNENLNEGNLNTAEKATVKKNKEENANKRASFAGGTNKRSSILIPSLQNVSTANPRTNMKLFFDLKRIKLIIVELTSNKEQPIDNSSNELISQDSTELKKKTTNTYTIIDFSHLEIQDIDFIYEKKDDLSWIAVFKMKELHLNDIRPDSNLAVKE